MIVRIRSADRMVRIVVGDGAPGTGIAAARVDSSKGNDRSGGNTDTASQKAWTLGDLRLRVAQECGIAPNEQILKRRHVLLGTAGKKERRPTDADSKRDGAGGGSGSSGGVIVGRDEDTLAQLGIAHGDVLYLSSCDEQGICEELVASGRPPRVPVERGATSRATSAVAAAPANGLVRSKSDGGFRTHTSSRSVRNSESFGDWDAADLDADADDIGFFQPLRFRGLDLDTLDQSAAATEAEATVRAEVSRVAPNLAATLRDILQELGQCDNQHAPRVLSTIEERCRSMYDSVMALGICAASSAASAAVTNTSPVKAEQRHSHLKQESIENDAEGEASSREEKTNDKHNAEYWKQKYGRLRATAEKMNEAGLRLKRTGEENSAVYQQRLASRNAKIERLRRKIVELQRLVDLSPAGDIDGGKNRPNSSDRRPSSRPSRHRGSLTYLQGTEFVGGGVVSSAGTYMMPAPPLSNASEGKTYRRRRGGGGETPISRGSVSFADGSSRTSSASSSRGGGTMP